MPLNTAPGYIQLLLRGLLAGLIAGLIAGSFAYFAGEPHVDAAIAIDPGIAVAHSNRAHALNMLDRPEEALTSADRAVALNPSLANAWRHRSLARARPGDLGSAGEATALRVVQAHGMGGDGPRREAGSDP